MTNIEVRRSVRRKKSIQAYRSDGRTIVLIPATLSKEQENAAVARMVDKLDRKERLEAPDAQGLKERAELLNRRYLDGAAVPRSIRWVANQRSRWGSCTPRTRDIRLSDRMIGMPGWVIDSVIVHELAHLIAPDHGPRFKELIARYPKTELANAFLQGVDFRRR